MKIYFCNKCGGRVEEGKVVAITPQGKRVTVLTYIKCNDCSEVEVFYDRDKIKSTFVTVDSSKVFITSLALDYEILRRKNEN